MDRVDSPVMETFEECLEYRDCEPFGPESYRKVTITMKRDIDGSLVGEIPDDTSGEDIELKQFTPEPVTEATPGIAETSFCEERAFSPTELGLYRSRAISEQSTIVESEEIESSVVLDSDEWPDESLSEGTPVNLFSAMLIYFIIFGMGFVLYVIYFKFIDRL